MLSLVCFDRIVNMIIIIFFNKDLSNFIMSGVKFWFSSSKYNRLIFFLSFSNYKILSENTSVFS